MKRILVLFLACVFAGCSGIGSAEVMVTPSRVPANEPIPEKLTGAYIDLPYNHFDLGKVNRKRTPSVAIEVEFTNKGMTPLIILKGDVSCGCLSVDYPKEPILPNHHGKITIIADLQTQEGTFNKFIFLKSNALNDVILVRLTGAIH